MKGLLIFLLVVAGWFVLQAYVLPKFGISTWLAPGQQVAGQNIENGKTRNKVCKIKKFGQKEWSTYLTIFIPCNIPKLLRFLPAVEMTRWPRLLGVPLTVAIKNEQTNAGKPDRLAYRIRHQSLHGR